VRAALAILGTLVIFGVVVGAFVVWTIRWIDSDREMTVPGVIGALCGSIAICFVGAVAIAAFGAWAFG
jgi:uncharacterized Tic20 family protein